MLIFLLAQMIYQFPEKGEKRRTENRASFSPPPPSSDRFYTGRTGRNGDERDSLFRSMPPKHETSAIMHICFFSPGPVRFDLCWGSDFGAVVVQGRGGLFFNGVDIITKLRSVTPRKEGVRKPLYTSLLLLVENVPSIAAAPGLFILRFFINDLTDASQERPHFHASSKASNANKARSCLAQKQEKKSRKARRW